MLLIAGGPTTSLGDKTSQDKKGVSVDQMTFRQTSAYSPDFALKPSQPTIVSTKINVKHVSYRLH